VSFPKTAADQHSPSALLNHQEVSGPWQDGLSPKDCFHLLLESEAFRIRLPTKAKADRPLETPVS
jgi:hypothetical protein